MSLFSIEGIAGSVVGMLVNLFAYVVGFVGGLILSLFGWIVNVMMDMNIQVFNLEQNTLVKVGWGIMRDFANLGFVLIIVVIAFGIMFRVEKYGSQKLLVRLIAAAIIVNFSLAIAGAFIQFSNVLTTFFLDRIPSPAGLGSALMGAFNPQRFNDPQNFSSQAEAVSTFGAELFALIAQTVFPPIFIFISVVTVGTFAIMLFIRYLHLTFLGVVAPIVWLFWVVPNLSHYFTDWWKDFIKWTFFAPAATFFIYLAFAALDAVGNEPALVANSPGSNFFSAGLITIMSQGIQMFVIGGIMLGGLIVAQKFGIESANIGMNIANKAKTGTLAWAGRAGKQAATRPLRGEWGRKLTETMQKTPLLRTAGTFLAKQRIGFEKKAADDAKKKLPKDLREQALQYGSLTTTNAGRVQIMENLAKERGKRDKKFEVEKKKIREKDTQINDLETQREEARKNNDLKLSGELTLKIDAARNQKDDLMKSEAYTNAEKNMKDIENAIVSLPKTAREALKDAGYKVGEVQIKPLGRKGALGELSGTKLGVLYGRKDTVMPGEDLTETVKKAVKEAEEAEGGSTEKKEEKKEEAGPKTT